MSKDKNQTPAVGWVNPARRRDGSAVACTNGNKMFSVNIDMDELSAVLAKETNVRTYDGKKQLSLVAFPVGDSFVLKENKPKA